MPMQTRATRLLPWTTRRVCRIYSVLFFLVAAFLGPGCSDINRDGDGQEPGTNKRMSTSKGQYTQGYQDGVRDAKWSLTEANIGSWSWIWMMEQEYQQGYEQGWADGRRQLKLEEKKSKQDENASSGRTGQAPSPGPQQDEARINVANHRKNTSLDRARVGPSPALVRRR